MGMTHRPLGVVKGILVKHELPVYFHVNHEMAIIYFLCNMISPSSVKCESAVQYVFC